MDRPAPRVRADLPGECGDQGDLAYAKAVCSGCRSIVGTADHPGPWCRAAVATVLAHYAQEHGTCPTPGHIHLVELTRGDWEALHAGVGRN